MTRALVAVVVLVAFATGGCGGKGIVSGDRAVATASAPAAERVIAFAKNEQGAAPIATYWAAQKLIRTADMRIQVRDVAGALKLTDSIARANESLVADSRTTQDAEGKKTSEILLHVPTPRFPGVIEALRSLGAVKQEGVGTQDVTKQYADLETRLAVKEQTVARLRTLLDSRSAKLSDVLDVERELSRAISELEQMKGERRYYDQQVALSTVKLTLFERAPARMARLAGPIADAFHNSLDVLGTSVGAIIYLIVAVAPWIAMALGSLWVVKRVRRQFVDGRSSSP
jgi:Domain of unknown function (DUF4349)